MKKKFLILSLSLIFPLSITESFAGTWLKKIEFDKGKNNSKSVITNDKTPETATEGLYLKKWVNENNIGLSLAVWLRNDKESISPKNEIFGNTSAGNIKNSYQWSERNPPLTLFSSEWTEVYYNQNKGDCDNRSLFNNKGKTEINSTMHFDFGSGPDDVLNDYYVIRLTTTSENSENKIKKNPKGFLTTGKNKSHEPVWLDKPDYGKSWHAAVGEIISFALSTDNGTSDNIWFKGYGGITAEIKLKDKAKNVYASIFHEISGFEFELEENISDSAVLFRTSLIQREGMISGGKLLQFWDKTANHVEIDREQIRQIDMILPQIRWSVIVQTPDESIFSESLKRYYDQFRDSFQGEYKEEAGYFLAWLIAEAVQRPVLTSEAIIETRKSFEDLIDKLEYSLNEKAKEAIEKSDFFEMQEELNENIAQVRGRLLYYFYELRNDTLFPLFKKPIDGNIEDIILQKLEKEDILYNLLNRQIKTKPKKDFYSKWINFYFEHLPERIIFWLVIETNKNSFRKPQYWGGMHYRGKSCSNGVWPIEMYLKRINE